MLEFYDRAGHDIREMLLSCFFRGEQCTPEDFKVVSAPAAPAQRHVSPTQGGCLSTCRPSCLLPAWKGPAASSLRGCQGIPPGFRGAGAPQELLLLGAAIRGAPCMGKAPPGSLGLCKARLCTPGWKPHAGNCRVVRRHPWKSRESRGGGRQGPEGALQSLEECRWHGVVPRHGGCVSCWCMDPAHNKAFIPLRLPLPCPAGN